MNVETVMIYGMTSAETGKEPGLKKQGKGISMAKKSKVLQMITCDIESNLRACPGQPDSIHPTSCIIL